MAIPGVGLPIPSNIPEGWRSTWCPQLRPREGEFDPPPEAWTAGWDWRSSCPTRGWVGGFGEVWVQRTTEALRLAWELNRWGTRSTHDGNFTVREYEYAAVYIPKTDAIFFDWWVRQEGGSRGRPYVFDDSNVHLNKAIVDAAKSADAWPQFGEVGSFSGWSGAPNGWEVYVKNMVVNEDEEPPVEPPTPEPEPPIPPDVDDPAAFELERVMDALERQGWDNRGLEAPSGAIARMFAEDALEIIKLEEKLELSPEPPEALPFYLGAPTDPRVFRVLEGSDNVGILFGERKRRALELFGNLINRRDRDAQEIRLAMAGLLGWIERYKTWRAS